MKLFRALLNLPRRAARFLRDRRGNIAVLTAVLLIPIVGALGLATEGGGWFLVGRAAQLAADQAALAAAANNDAATQPGDTNYQLEGLAVATKNGFTNDAHTTVTLEYKSIPSIAACASPSECYVATVKKVLPLALTHLVGFSGDANYNGGIGSGQTIKAIAVATALNLPVNDCLLALNGGITFNGFKNGNLAGCTLGSNGDIACDGHDGNYRNVNYSGVNKNDKCPDAVKEAVTDPYAATVATDMKTIVDNCGGNYPQEPVKMKDPPLPMGNVWSGSKALLATQVMCGDVQLTADTTISSSSVLVIENGFLDLNGHKLSSAAGTGLTIVFSGSNAAGYQHYPSATGTLDIAAPNAASGSVWEGLAIVQDPKLTTNLSPKYIGNQPTWDISGLVYMPNAALDFGGTVNKSSNGFSCFTLVAASINVGGNGDIFADNSQCAQAGVPTSGTAPAGAQLVF